MVRSRGWAIASRSGELREGAEALREAYLHVSPSVSTLCSATPALFGVAYRR
jgi:hypothetical protein